VIAFMEAGGEVDEGTALRVVRSPRCTARAIELMLLQPAVRRSRTLLAQVVRHPACPRPFAWDALPTLGWRDLLAVATDHRALPPIRRQAERKLAERIRHMALGERVALARQASRGLLPSLMRDASARCIGALLENPRFTETDAVRLVATSVRPEAVREVLRHQRWGAARGVVEAAIRSSAVPLGVALGLAASMPVHELQVLLAGSEIGEPLKTEIARLIERRSRRPVECE
jgi:hypothetical protein